MAETTFPPASLAERTFDYIIVGGGTAGLVVAARLSEDSSISVLVLEAGAPSFDTSAIDIPGRYGEAIGSEQDWQYSTVPQPGLRGRRLPWPRGKVLGGTSALNFMAWNRPSRQDLDAWEELGNHGWGWDEVEPFYRKSEHFTVPSDSDNKQHRLQTELAALGTQGPIPISYMREYSLSHKHWHQTLNNLGVKTNERHMSGSNVGVWTNMVAVDPRTLKRSYSATAYYLPNAIRENLVVITGALAREVSLEQDHEKWVAKGIRYEYEGDEYQAKASEEVIISAGSVASPQLLEVSGIGNPAVLEAAKISVRVANINVGEHVQDHMMTATIFEVDPSTPTQDDFRTNTNLAAAADEQYVASQSGPRTVLPGSFCYLPLSHFIPADKLSTLAERATNHLPSTPANVLRSRRLFGTQRLGSIEYIFDLGNWSPFLMAKPGKKYATLLQILQYPFSHGSIHINPADTMRAPLIDPRYYGGPHGALDLEIQCLCAEFIGQKIVSTAPLKDMIHKRVSPPAEASNGDELKEWIVDNTITDWHPIGSCSMGGYLGAEAGVVDERLRVYGVKGLRVVDASVMPLQISAHLQATVYAIAEKASRMIIEDREEGESSRQARP
ncbi:hypothetical protein LTR35_017449 [Friedmanniomyces endolithicus]|nr:hypothetical protein LTR35_017449 [Friedmanniomyces endolithicus]KAK0269672.1 hypothetical protein LTS00_017202 [Friedmanniomyces endolithicus]KAK0973380.1 hypothetical protein LTR54_017364 [Friedmanniomyces endolithicus]